MTITNVAGMLRPYFVSVLPTTVWNPSDKGGSIVLSDSNKAYTFTSSGWQSVRTNDFKSSGKWYVEHYIAKGINYTDVGFGNAAANLVSYPGATADSVGVVNNGDLYRNGFIKTFTTTFVANDVFAFALDLTNRKFWVRKNNGAWNPGDAGTQDPASNQGGQALAANMLTGNVYCMGGLAQVNFITGNWAAYDQRYAPPAGFSPWDPGVPAASALILSNQWRFNLITRLGAEMWWNETYFRLVAGAQQDAIHDELGTANASNPQSGYPAFGAFNNSLSGTTWAGATAVMPQTLGFEFAYPKAVREVEIVTVGLASANGVGQFEYQYYNGSSWVTIQSRTLVAADYSAGTGARYKFTVQ